MVDRVVMVELYHQVISLVVVLRHGQELKNGMVQLGQKPLLLVKEMEMLVDVHQPRYTVLVVCMMVVKLLNHTMLVYVQCYLVYQLKIVHHLELKELLLDLVMPVMQIVF